MKQYPRRSHLIPAHDVSYLQKVEKMKKMQALCHANVARIILLQIDLKINAFQEIPKCQPVVKND